LEHVLGIVAAWVKHCITVLGYPGVMGLMAMESACIPIPSEVIMPFSGFLVQSKVFASLHAAALSGAFGEAIGSSIGYLAGMYGGRPFLDKYGRYLLIRKRDMDRTTRVFDKFGEPVVFIGRLLPIIRTFISFPAGVARMSFAKFLAFSVVGSVIWCYFLTYVGMVLGRNWQSVRTYFHGADKVVAVLIVLAFVFWLYHHLKPEAEEK
jgi:membrane protein DedA with SNARE-associated domain